jgi:hypothetical protein
LSSLDLTYDELTKILVDDSEDETEENIDIRVDQLENSSWTSQIAIIYYVLHHNEVLFHWMKIQKPNAFFGDVEVQEIEIQRFKDFNLKELLDYVEKHYSKVAIKSTTDDLKESIYSKMIKLCTFQVPQYFNTQVLLITEFLKNSDDKKLVRLTNKYNLKSALESLLDDKINSLDDHDVLFSSRSEQLHAYHISLSEKPYKTAISVIRFLGFRYRRFKIRYDYEEFFKNYEEYGVYNILFSDSFHNQLFGNLRKEKHLTSLSCFNFNLSECVLKSETLLRIWCD